MRRGWLLRRGDVLAAAEVSETVLERSRGLIGRSSLDGVMLLTHTRAIHTFGVRFPIDVAFLDHRLQVLATATVARHRLTLPRWRGRAVLEAPAGSFERWGLLPGDELEFREAG